MAKYQTILRNRATEAEICFYRLVNNLGLNLIFQKHYNRTNGKVYYPDFKFVPTRKQLHQLKQLHWPVKSSRSLNTRLIVEIDGLYHERQALRDKIRQQEIEKGSKIQYKFLRFTNDQVLYFSNRTLLEFFNAVKELWNIELNFQGVIDVLVDNQAFNKNYEWYE